MKLVKPSTITTAMVSSYNVTEPESGYPEWIIGTAYTAGDDVTDSLTHKLFTCLASNTGHYPPDYLTVDTAVEWVEVGSTNAWSMFDTVVGSQTVFASPITLEIAPGQTDSIIFLDLDATEISISMDDPVDGVVYTETIDLLSTLGIIDGYTYFFNPIATKEATIRLDLPPYALATIEVIVTNAGATAKVGTLAFGMQQSLGCSQYGVVIGLTDYSRKDVDIYGNYSILERAYAKKLDIVVDLPNTSLDGVAKLLALYRATPVIWIGADDLYSSMLVYGFYRSFSIVVAYYSHSTCNLEIEGLS